MPKAKTETKTNSKSLMIQKRVAWTLVIFGLLVFAGVSMTTVEAPTAPPSPLDLIWSPLLFVFLPLIWLKRVNDLQGLKRYLSTKSVIIAFTVGAVFISSWAFYRDAQKYFVHQDELVSQKFAAVNIIYKKRFDLVPNVAKSAKALGAHERAVIDSITSARASYLRNNKPDGKVTAINDFNRAFTEISINIENYPALKGDKGFLELITVLEETEEQLVEAKNDYNKQVTTLNTQSRTFPYNLLAGSLIEEPVKTRLEDSADTQIQNAKQLLDSLN